MLVELLIHLLSLDFGWIITLPLQNPLMAFMLFAVFYVFLEGKNIVRGCIVIFITLFAFMDFEKILGVTFFTTSFLLIYYISKLAVLSIAEGNAMLKKNLIFINEMHFFAAFIFSLLISG